jgi:RNA polymerase sigma-70 factor, ECF subfamily
LSGLKNILLLATEFDSQRCFEYCWVLFARMSEHRPQNANTNDPETNAFGSKATFQADCLHKEKNMATLMSLQRDEVREFYNVSYDQAWRYLARMTGGDRSLTEDLLQEVMLSVIQDVSRGRLPRHDHAWIITVARNRFLNYVRSVRRDEARVARANDRSAATFNPDATERARELLSYLPIEQRAAVALRHLDGYSTAEIADYLDRTVSATESLIARGVRTLRQLAPEN